MTSATHKELWDLLEGLCEDKLTDAELLRLDEIVVSDKSAREVYVKYLHLHGNLHYDTAIGSGEIPVFDLLPPEDDEEATVQIAESHSSNLRRVRIMTAASAALVLIALFVTFVNDSDQPIASNNEPGFISDVPIVGSETPRKDEAHSPAVNDRERNPDEIAANPIELRKPRPEDQSIPESPRPARSVDPQQESVVSSKSPRLVRGSNAATIEYINERIREQWKLADIQPSESASDAEWLRRVYLDIVGHIPPLDETQQFLDDESEDKRQRVVAQLLDDSGYVRNFTTVWSNLLIGRSTSRKVNRTALRRYLRRSFAENRAWNEMVVDFVSAQGKSTDNGATNFLLAKLDNQARPKMATAVAQTAQVFMGIQIQCMQCHDHPYNDWKMNEFWSLASFFDNMEDKYHREFNDDQRFMTRYATLKSEPVAGHITFERRTGLVSIAYPQLFEKRASQDAVDGIVDRRQELAKMMVQGDKPLIASAMVNRMWAHFFGHGFTAKVDDMGPHAHPSHPALLDQLSRQFVRSGFDIKRLVTWICLSDAYQLSSQFNDTNFEDDPAHGFDPMFSRAYVRQMTAEQLYDSLIVATKANETAGSDWTEAEKLRQEWLQQFVLAFDSDDLAEASLFNGTVSQALMLMNGELIDRAVSLERGTLLRDLVVDNKSEDTLITQVSLAALSREPSASELAGLRTLLNSSVATRPQRTASNEALLSAIQDVFWAYLNSNEFILIH